MPALLTLAQGCAPALSPALRFDREARSLGLTRHSISGAGFDHTAYTGPDWTGPGRLHVYLDGDGTPFLRRSQVATDPTPRRYLVLRLMASDRRPALYLGRPCYHGGPDRRRCPPTLWTGARYGPAVVASLHAALTRLLADRPERPLVLIGYSGGATLAMLLAEHLPATRAVLTVAGNLDPDAWTGLHGYTPLTGSLNPARRPPLPARILQQHYAGQYDRNLPPALVAAALSARAGPGARPARLRVIPGFSHGCCWTRIWPAVLGRLDRALAQAPGRPP